MSDPGFEFPAYAHVPGENPRHPDGFADAVIDTMPEIVQNDGSPVPPAFPHALALIRNAFFWEAHEVLEAIWMRTPRNSREYHVVQGIIHITNFGLKRRMNRPAAVQRLRALAEESLQRGFRPGDPGPVLGVTRQELNGLMVHIDEI